MKRTILLSCALAASCAVPSAAQMIAPNATSDLEYLKGLDDTAKNGAKELDAEGLFEPPAPLDFEVSIPALSEMLRTQPILREMLNLDDLNEELKSSEIPDYREYGVVLVSFSMPDQSLREVALQADKYGFTTVFRGLVNNTFSDTLAKLSEVFGDDVEHMRGFSINPTAFNRFDVVSVPAYLFLAEPLKPCTSKGCVDDPTPDHDVVYGNIPFADAAEIVVKGEGVGAFAASQLLAFGGKK